MSTVAFDRDSMATWYATQHLKVDEGITEVVYLPTNAGEQEIRFLEINADMLDADDSLGPVSYGVDMGTGMEHELLVIDATIPFQETGLDQGFQGKPSATAA
jgi:hypothetical protein